MCNAALWQALWRLPELHGNRGLWSSAALPILIAATLYLLLSLVACRWTVKPLITAFLFASAFGAYFMLTYGVVIDRSMIVNALQTDQREVLDLLNGRMLLTVVLLAAIPAGWLWRQTLAYPRPLRQLAVNAVATLASCVLIMVTLLATFQDFSSLMRNHTQLRYLINPLNSFYALGSAAVLPFRQPASALLPLGEDAQLGRTYTAQPKPPLLLLVLGETARSGNFALNGYARPTTPELARENVVSQRLAWSCGTSTAASVPCMFSNQGRAGFGKDGARYEGLLDVLQRAGLAVLWIDNQSGCKGVCDRVNQVGTIDLKVPGVCGADECFDEVMLQQIDAQIEALPAARRARGVVVVMHQMGGHGPAYYKRSPAASKKFFPECTSNALPDCGRQELMNAYDNSVVYTDQFLAASIAWLKKREAQAATALLYVGDHGESLGENNLYLHGLPYSVAPDVQKQVPWISWLSASFENRASLSTACLRQHVNDPISHDNYFHSVLGLLDIQSTVYRPAMDIYAECSHHAVL